MKSRKRLERRESLGQLIQRRMDDLEIDSISQLARRLGYSRSYLTHLTNDTSPAKRGHYLPEPKVIKKLSEVLVVNEAVILRSLGYFS